MSRHGPQAREVDDIEHLWIPMPDGVRLAARMWLPRDAEASPVPAVVEYIPYRKRDMVRARDERNHPYIAGHGYACLRVDMRGSGDSDGVMADMYAEDELADARRMIGWVARQPWCSGRVGMFGTSWGGTASLQASIDAPGALRAVIAVCATHDRYEDDIHHKGGCLLTDSLEWGATLPAILASPPSPEVGPDWMDRWRDRLNAIGFPVEAWLREEARGDYWRRGSVRFQADRIACPVLAVGGWSDRYSNSVMSLVEARPDIVWGVVGPWGHHYPDHGHPGPAIGFQQLALEWWDHWLKPAVPAAPGWPRLRVWLREFDPPADVIDRRNGAWIESGPASDHARVAEYRLGPSGLASSAPEQGEWILQGDLRHGECAGDTGYFGRFGGLPLDQRGDDSRARTFDTPALAEDLTIFGSVEAELAVAAAEPRSQLVLRLCDVSPEGVSARIGLSVLNLALDGDLDAPEVPHPPRPRTVRLRFHTTAYRVRKGHRLRLAIGTSYWPMVWTPPTKAGVTLHQGVLRVPVMVGAPRPLAVPFEAPLDLPQVKQSAVTDAPRLVRFFETRGRVRVTGWRQPEVSVRHHAIDTGFAYETAAEHGIDPEDPLSAHSVFRHRMRFERPDGTAEVTSALKTRGTKTQFLSDGRLTVTWNGDTLLDRRWAPRIGRRLS